VTEARSLTGARYGALGVLDEAGRTTVDFLASGLDPEDEARLMRGPLPTGRGVLGVLISDPRPIRIPVISDHPASTGFPAGHPAMTSFLGAPIKVGDRVYGNLYLTDKLGADEFTRDDEVVIEALAVAAGIAVENARLHQRAGEVAVYEDRDRLARDLHDGVIQRLFAIGLSLQGLAATPSGRAVSPTLEAAIADIDETIRQVRATIFELGGAGDGRGIRSHVLALADELQPVVGFDVPVDIIGAVDTAVTDAVADQLLPVLREALTNIGRHAGATRARIRLATVGRYCRLEVSDNGRGFDGAQATEGGMGLANMRDRAERLGGTFEVTHPAQGGTTIVWQVPTFTDRQEATTGDR
jgi:signal transduction histidine kinase